MATLAALMCRLRRPRLMCRLAPGGANRARVGIGKGGCPGGAAAVDPEPAVTELADQQPRARIQVGDGNGPGGTPAAPRLGDCGIGRAVVDVFVAKHQRNIGSAARRMPWSKDAARRALACPVS